MQPPPAARPAPPPHRLGAVGLLAGTAAAVSLVGLLAALVTWRFHPEPKPPCVANCPPPVVKPFAASGAPAAAMAEPHVYRSSQLGFSVGYESPPWSAAQQSGGGVLLEGGNGAVAFRIAGHRTNGSPVQLVLDAAKSLDSSSLPDVTPDHEILGARIGTVPGTGEVYAATYVPGSGGGQAQAVRIPIIAAEQNGLGVFTLGIAPYDRSTPGGVGAGDFLDYLLTEFSWPGG